MSNRPTVALIYPGCHRRGGVERCVREVARGLSRNFQVTFVGDDFDPDGMDDVAFLPAGGKRLPGTLGQPSFRRRARKTLHAQPFDAVISWGSECPPGDLLAVASIHRAWLRRGRSIPTRLGPVPNWARYLMPQHFVRLILEKQYFGARNDSIVSVLSQQSLQEVHELYGVESNRLVVIPNGYSSDDFSVARTIACRASRRIELGLGDEDILILLVANELHRKGFGVLLQAVSGLADPRVRIAVVGKASIEPYGRQISDLGLQGSVRWYGPSDDVAQWYAAADLFVMPSQYEAFPLVVIEALASGLPVITTAFAGSIDAVVPGTNGLLMSDPDDVDELVGLLRQAMDPAARAAWRQAAPESVSRLEWRVIADRYAELLATL